MSLFEIELNDNFKIRNDHVFFQEKHFKDLYKKNNLNDSYNDDIGLYLPDEYILRVDKSSILVNQNVGVSFEVNEIENMLTSDIYGLYPDGGEQNLYPEWLLFYVAVKKKQVKWIFEEAFNEQVEFFKYIAEIRYKEYVTRNTRNFIPISRYTQAFEIEKDLYGHYLDHVKSSNMNVDKLLNFLGFLCKFHGELKKNEKYKLMWNLETYVEKTIWLLHEKGISYEEIYTNPIDSDCSILQNIYIYKPLYIKDNKMCFQIEHLEVIQNIFGNEISIDDLMNKVITKKEYEGLIFTYIQLIERFNSNKKSEVVMGALARSVILDIEEKLKNKIDYTDNKFSLYRHGLKKLSSNLSLLSIYRGKREKSSIVKLKEVLHKDESLEKYLMIYYHARNYFAHQNVDIYKFFEAMDDETIYIHKIIASMIVILYRLEDFDTDNDVNTNIDMVQLSNRNESRKQ